MVAINHDVDSNDVSGGDWPLLKDGDYPAAIVEATTKTSKAGDEYLVIQFDLGTGGNHGHTLNLWHSTSEKARQIATQELNQIGVALGIPRIGDTDELIGKRLILKMGTEPAKDEWPAKNKIVGYKPLNEGPPTGQPEQSPPQVTTQTEATAPAEPTPVWNT